METNPHPYASFVHRVQKPARYVGGERNQVQKDWTSVNATVCLAFPDIYDIGMSHLGTKILYKTLNDQADIACERAFAPWHDMEAELRTRELPIFSLESARPLREFDIVGISLQYEMNFTNVLTLLDLSNIPLRSEDRAEDDPLILGGGPVATHPESVAPFFDAFLVGDAEGRLPELVLTWTADRKAGLSRRDALIHMAEMGGVYVPSLYTLAIDERSGLQCINAPTDERVPAVVTRAFVENIDKYPFPSDSPIAAAEAIFDRMSIEIARGCTEGCRFCQAGMIYRPVRERSPDDIVDTLMAAIDEGGFDEASLTSLSTADYSCIDPLIRRIMKKLREKNVSLGVSSLRAYGLNEGLLDEIRSVRATGLTFAPEAGTQRMRDVVNKNVTEEDISNTAHRVFSRGWNRMKTYFMIGLPTEQDEDVVGIVETAHRLKEIGRQYHRNRAEVVASVSSHVPKPHTPFQWAAMDTMSELKRKQRLLGDLGRQLRVRVKYHNQQISYLEGIMARGDRRVADLVELAWRKGCRFDGWDECLRFDHWVAALEELDHIDPSLYLGTLPVDGGLPWDHIDMGLADGFLRKEWKRTLKNRLSPPCGKPVGEQVHHTNITDAEADARKLVCYHCGVACDMTAMRDERIDFLKGLGALTPPEAQPMVAPFQRSEARKPKVREDAAKPEDMVRYRLRYTSDELMRLQGHSDMLRILPRVMRRAQLPVGYSWGFHPKPIMSFSPALPLGTYSVGELVDVSLSESLPVAEVLERLNAASEPGLAFLEARLLTTHEPNIAKRLHAADYLVCLPGVDKKRVAGAALTLTTAETVSVPIVRKKGEKTLDVRPAIVGARVAAALEWPADITIQPNGPVLFLSIRQDVPAARPREILNALLGEEATENAMVVRTAFWRLNHDQTVVSPLDIAPAPPEKDAPQPETIESPSCAA
jgi:radical SAM family uncharacterized protein/radical SAM-linked protein